MLWKNLRNNHVGRRLDVKLRSGARMHNVLLAFVFLLIVLLFLLINLFTRDREFSESENRNLSQKPAFSLSALIDGSYFSGITDWYNDQFFARDGWISLKLWERLSVGAKGIRRCLSVRK